MPTSVLLAYELIRQSFAGSDVRRKIGMGSTPNRCKVKDQEQAALTETASQMVREWRPPGCRAERRPISEEVRAGFGPKPFPCTACPLNRCPEQQVELSAMQKEKDPFDSVANEARLLKRCAVKSDADRVYRIVQ
jgi:hypothetical protein